MKNAGPCARCKCEVWIPDALYEAAQHGRGKVTFFCGYGHGQMFAVGESEETKLRREREETTERRLNATRGVVTRIKNRVGHGVCPCCNRSFTNVARHMASEHPTWSAEAAE